MAAAIISVGFFGFLAAFKGSDAYRLATQYASEHDLIKEEIGEVTGFSFFPQGNISTSSSGGQATFLLNLVGDRGEGKLFIELVSVAGGD